MTLRVLVTGSDGFIGRNLVDRLRRIDGLEVLPFGREEADSGDYDGVARADIVYHLAGVNRPESLEEFRAGNVGLTAALCEVLLAEGRKVPIVFASSTQVDQENPYGKSKRDAEVVLEQYAERSSADVAVFRLSNVFGKWCRPNYNSVVATFCHNVARGLPLKVDDPARDVTLVYIDHVVSAFERVGAQLAPGTLGLEHSERPVGEGDPGHVGVLASSGRLRRCYEVVPKHTVTLGELADQIHTFRESRTSLWVPDFSDEFHQALYATYLSYLEEGDFAYGLVTHTDDRGSLAEFLKSPGAGQIFVSRTKSGVTRGNHYHSTKTEKFLVLEGSAVIRLRRVGDGAVIEYPVTGGEFRVVDIPPGYTHSIENTGGSDLVTLFWASEIFDPERPDTVYLEV